MNEASAKLMRGLVALMWSMEALGGYKSKQKTFTLVVVQRTKSP